MIARDMLAALRPAVVSLAIAGFLLGLTYFGALLRGVRVAVAQRAWLPCVLWALARIAAAALFFTFAVRYGASALLAAFVGFLAARQLAVRALRRAA